MSTPSAIPSLYEWAGGMAAFERLTEIFYSRVAHDPALGGAVPAGRRNDDGRVPLSRRLLFEAGLRNSKVGLERDDERDVRHERDGEGLHELHAIFLT